MLGGTSAATLLPGCGGGACAGVWGADLMGIGAVRGRTARLVDKSILHKAESDIKWVGMYSMRAKIDRGLPTQGGARLGGFTGRPIQPFRAAARLTSCIIHCLAW